MLKRSDATFFCRQQQLQKTTLAADDKGVVRLKFAKSLDGFNIPFVGRDMLERSKKRKRLASGIFAPQRLKRPMKPKYAIFLKSRETRISLKRWRREYKEPVDDDQILFKNSLKYLGEHKRVSFVLK